MSELLCLHDAYLRSFTGRVDEVRDDQVCLDRTAFYPTGGGQPHDTGRVSLRSGTQPALRSGPQPALRSGPPPAEARVVAVRKEGERVWHTIEGPVPAVGDEVSGEVDWDRRHALMRTHTALHVLCGVIWHRWGVPVTGGNMEPLSARMDFEFDPLPEGFGPMVEELVNAELDAARPVDVAWLPRDQALRDEDLIRTKVSLIPEGVDPVRIIDIVGLDKQADGGLHVRSTDEVGRVRVVKTESKGKGFKRVRLEVLDG